MEKSLQSIVERLFQKKLEDCTKEEVYSALMQLVKENIQQTPRDKNGRKLYYISAEFLIGKLLSNNLINLGLYEDVKAVLAKHGHSLAEVEEAELEPSLGNGGLGRLAACFLDSIATLGLNGDGVGLNYHFGLFQQFFRNHKQQEEINPWITKESWLNRTETSFEVPFQDFTLKSVLYDIDVTGYQGCCNKLHLFDVESVEESLVKDGIQFDKEDIPKNLTLFLYPDDSDEAGRLLRIYQQYFLVSNAAQLILKELKENGHPLEELADHVVIQINDTHPTMVIPELIRLLTEQGIKMEKAIDIVSHTCAYTNHTILAEALEKWSVAYLEKVVPQLMPIIETLDKMAKEKFSKKVSSPAVDTVVSEDTKDTTNTTKSVEPEKIPEVIDDSLSIIDQHQFVHMAHIDIHYGFSVNGVAALHTEILKKSELKKFYEAYPEKFNNKTNGITFRRWLIHCNPELAEYITELIGDGWKKDANQLEKLLAFQDDTKVLEKFLELKQLKKDKLKDYLKETQNIEIARNSIYDIQVKRLHEYKRQQMNCLYAIYKYLQIKKGNLPKRPITMIFGAKAAPAYIIAKDIIHLILCLQELINNDPEVSPYLKVVMIENYNVTKAEVVIPACDISEQISLASKEASGTGNMKFMLNSAVTLGTMDGANVEIHDLVGDENIYIFGKSSEEVIKLYDEASYCSAKIYDSDPEIEELVDFIINKKMIRIGDPLNLCRLYKELIGKDWFMTLLDVKEYIQVKEKMLGDYENQLAWAKKMLVNTAKAGFFSSDRTIAQYNQDIWNI